MDKTELYSLFIIQTCRAEGVIDIQHEQDISGDQLATIARDQKHIAGEQANVRKEFGSIVQAQDDLDCEFKELRLE